jgi:hypothetical protein
VHSACVCACACVSFWTLRVFFFLHLGFSLIGQGVSFIVFFLDTWGWDA